MKNLLFYWHSFYNRLQEKQVSQYSSLYPLLETIDESYQYWQNTLQELNLVENELIDYMSYRIIAAQKRYILLLKQARNQGITAWPADQLKPVCRPEAI